MRKFRYNCFVLEIDEINVQVLGLHTDIWKLIVEIIKAKTQNLLVLQKLPHIQQISTGLELRRFPNDYCINEHKFFFVMMFVFVVLIPHLLVYVV